jgi:hypothetical protein
MLAHSANRTKEKFRLILVVTMVAVALDLRADVNAMVEVIC